jgi:hypothetical protein
VEGAVDGGLALPDYLLEVLYVPSELIDTPTISAEREAPSGPGSCCVGKTVVASPGERERKMTHQNDFARPVVPQFLTRLSHKFEI